MDSSSERGSSIYVRSYIRCKDSARAHIFALHCASGVQTDLSSNSIEQHRVPAWPAGRPREYQHSLLVVQGNAPSCSQCMSIISMSMISSTISMSIISSIMRSS